MGGSFTQTLGQALSSKAPTLCPTRIKSELRPEAACRVSLGLGNPGCQPHTCIQNQLHQVWVQVQIENAEPLLKNN